MPDGPIGTKKNRVQKALYWYWTQDYSQQEIADKLGVSQRAVSNYVREAPTSDAIQKRLDDLETQVRYAAIEDLRSQLKEASRRETAEKPVKIWQDEDGNLCVNDKRDDSGQVIDRYPVPQDFELGADEQARFYARSEKREILDLLTDIVGAKAAERQKIEHSGDGGGPIEMTINYEEVTADDVDDDAAE